VTLRADEVLETILGWLGVDVGILRITLSISTCHGLLISTDDCISNPTIKRMCRIGDDLYQRNSALLGGALAGKTNMFYCLVPNPVAGENCLHFSIFGDF
jgi:hypothetical protein